MTLFFFSISNTIFIYTINKHNKYFFEIKINIFVIKKDLQNLQNYIYLLIA